MISRGYRESHQNGGRGKTNLGYTGTERHLCCSWHDMTCLRCHSVFETFLFPESIFFSSVTCSQQHKLKTVQNHRRNCCWAVNKDLGIFEIWRHKCPSESTPLIWDRQCCFGTPCNKQNLIWLEEGWSPCWVWALPCTSGLRFTFGVGPSKVFMLQWICRPHQTVYQEPVLLKMLGLLDKILMHS